MTSLHRSSFFRRAGRGRIAALLVTVGVAGAALDAAAPARLDGQAPRSAAVLSDILPALDSAPGELSSEVRAHVSRGDELTAKRHYAAGQQEFRRAVEIARQQGHLPSLELWRLASAYYYEGRSEQAGRALDELATEAASVGDLPVEARAIFSSAWLFQDAGKRSEAGKRIGRLKKLLRSPYVPAAVRDSLLERIVVTSR